MKVSYLNDEFFSRLETSVLHLRANLAGFFGGKHLVKTYGQTVEFADYREYMLGDDIRRIDWNLYSRFEKYFLKLFTDERQMHTQIFLDCSASMGKVADQDERQPRQGGQRRQPGSQPSQAAAPVGRHPRHRPAPNPLPPH